MASYLTIQEADNLISELYTSFSKERSFWNSLDNSDKQALLNKYSSNLCGENTYMWKGIKKDPQQELDFPRVWNNRELTFNKNMAIGMITMMLEAEKNTAVDSSDMSSNISEIKQSGVKKFQDGGGMSIEFSDTTTVNDNISSTCKIGYIPQSIFDRYFRYVTYLV